VVDSRAGKRKIKRRVSENLEKLMMFQSRFGFKINFRMKFQEFQ
jgi:hypothetical protein